MILTKFFKTTYSKILKPRLFSQDPEKVHDGFSKSGRFIGSNPITRTITRVLFSYSHPSLEQEVSGIKFRNPVGLSAGFDKEVMLHKTLKHVGFGYMQMGSITLHPYEGNPPPRLYRLPKSKALVVYYGLKNLGVKETIKRFAGYKDSTFPISFSIAKTNSKGTCTTDEGVQDYYGSYKALVDSDSGDFYTINISCPNTYGGEPFTTPEKLEALLKQLRTVKTEKPLYIKMAINLPWDEFKALLEVIVKYKVDGVIIGNLNKDHKSKTIKDEIPSNVKGGISGKVTWELSNNLISKTYKEYGDKLVIVGVGGIFSAEDAYEKIKRGATLVQLITGMVFEGPQLIGEINKGLVRLMKEDGYQHISEAIGTKHK